MTLRDLISLKKYVSERKELTIGLNPPFLLSRLYWKIFLFFHAYNFLSDFKKDVLVKKI